MSLPRDIWRLLNLPCEGMTELGSRAFDGPMGRAERLALKVHLLTCGPCRRFLRQVGELRVALKRFSSEDESGRDLTGPRLPDEIRERIRRSIRDR